MFNHSVQSLKAEVLSTLASNNIDVDNITGLNEVFLKAVHPFQELETCYKQEKYFKEYLKLVVSGIAIYCTLQNHRYSAKGIGNTHTLLWPMRVMVTPT